MANEHFSSVLNSAIELMIYSEGSIGWTDIMEMSVDELPYVIHNMKTHYEAKQKNKDEFIKEILKFASNGLNNLVKALAGRR
jgi:hypothetical protein